MNFLYICTHNACRSILAEAITRAISNGRIEAASAGSAPGGRVHPLTLQYLEAHGYPTQHLSSKGLDELGSFVPDVVITVCDSAASEACPIWPDSEPVKIHWGLPDPSHLPGSDAQRERAFEHVASTIRSRIGLLLEEPFETFDRATLSQLLQSIGKD